MTLILQQAVNGLMVGVVYVTIAVAFTLTVGVLNFLNFTIPGLFMAAGMVAWALATQGLPFGLAGPMNWLVALAGGVGAAIVLSLIVERVCYRSARTRFGDATEHAIPLVSSLGCLLVINNLVQIRFGGDTHAFVTPYQAASFRWGGLLFSAPQLVSLAISLLFVLSLSLILKKTKIGRAIRAIAENPEAAAITGVDVMRIVPVIFLISGLLCGLAAVNYLINYGQVSPTMGDDIGAKAIAGMVLGGLGSIWGAIAGGLLVGFVEAFSIEFLGSDAIQVSVWGLLLIVLLVRPKGLFGHQAIGKGKL